MTSPLRTRCRASSTENTSGSRCSSSSRRRLCAGRRETAKLEVDHLLVAVARRGVKGAESLDVCRGPAQSPRDIPAWQRLPGPPRVPECRLGAPRSSDRSGTETGARGRRAWSRASAAGPRTPDARTTSMLTSRPCGRRTRSILDRKGRVLGMLFGSTV